MLNIERCRKAVKKSKISNSIQAFTTSFIFIMLFGWQTLSGQVAYTQQTANADIQLNGGTNSIVTKTACDALEYTISAVTTRVNVFAWDGSNAGIGYTINGGTPATALSYTQTGTIEKPDVALVYYDNGIKEFLSLVVVYLVSGTIYTDVFNYDFTFQTFSATPVIATSLTSSTAGTFHVDGDNQGHFIVVWDYNNEIYFWPGVIDPGLLIDITYGDRYREFTATTTNNSMPDVALNSTGYGLNNTFVYLTFIAAGSPDVVQVFNGELSDFMTTSWIVVDWNPTSSNDHAVEIDAQGSGCAALYPSIALPLDVNAAQSFMGSTKPICVVTWQEDCSGYKTVYITNTRDISSNPNPVLEVSDLTGSTSSDDNTFPMCVTYSDVSRSVVGWNYYFQGNSSNMTPITYGVLTNHYDADAGSGNLPLIIGSWNYNLIENPTTLSDPFIALSLATDGTNVLYFYYNNSNATLYYKFYDYASAPRLAAPNQNLLGSLFPNPFNTVLNFLPPVADAVYQLKITDISGNERCSIAGDNHQLQTALDRLLPSFKAGTYLFNFVDNKSKNNWTVKALKSN